MPQKYFDLHFEIGVGDAGGTYAKTVIDGKEVYREDRGVVNAVAAVCLELHSAGMWSKLSTNPNLSKFPFTGSSAAAAVNSKPNGKLLRPSDLTQVPHPDCQAQCISYDLFGKIKCPNMCQQRSGI